MNFEVFFMNSIIIKMMIALLPTAPVVGEYMAGYEPAKTENAKQEQNKNELTETIEDIQAKVTTDYPKLFNVDEFNVQVGDSFDPLEGVYAVDKRDGDVTDNITTSGDVDTSTIGDYYLKYKVTNNTGGWYEITRIVHVSENPTDKIKPTPKTFGRDSDKNKTRVTFTSIDDVEISVGSDFDPKKGVKIYDTDGHDITNDAIVQGDKVDTEKVGEYFIAYTVIDRFGKANAAARKVTVK